MTTFNDLTSTLSLLKSRRSVIANNMEPPGPSAEQIDELLEIAARVPDHGKLAPWRFILFRGSARAAFGRLLAARQQLLSPQIGAELMAFEAARFERAETVIGVVSRIERNHKIPEWEQQLSAGAVCQNLLIAATAMGFAAQWITEWYAYDEEVAKQLGLSENERMAGFIYLSSSKQKLNERPRPAVAALTSHWTG